jgi:methylated-DNA-[protein]-cysteine S-methyltransferase
MSHAAIDTPIGPLTVVTNDVGVTEILFGTVPDPEDGVDSPGAERALTIAVDQLREYFAGTRTQFDVPLDRSARSGFHGEVLDALEQVRFGESVTYGELAGRAGRPSAARAAGTAMATNPIPVIVPCHRVLPATGGTGNYGGGVPAKDWLLDFERAAGR